MTDETLAARLAHCEKERDKWRDEAGDYQVKLSVLDHDTTGKIHKLRELIERYKQEQKSYFGENAILEDEAGEWEWMNKELKAERDDLRGRCERLKGALREIISENKSWPNQYGNASLERAKHLLDAKGASNA